MKNTIKKTNWINVLVIAAVAFGTGLVALAPSPSPVQAEAVTITTNATNEYTVQSYNYPSSTISGISNNIPDNAVIVELGYGSDDDNNYLAATVGEFYQKEGGGWGVRTTGGAKTNYRLTSHGTEGVIVSLNAPFATWISPADTYLTRWGWASSHTSGGTPAPGPDNFPVNVCVHAKYKLFDPVTHVIDNSQTYESGNCSSMQYDPSWIRAKVVADPNTFFTAIGQFQIGHDANLAGGRAHIRQLSSQTLTLDAAYVSDTVPRTPLAVSTQYQSQIRMKNTSNVMWAGDSFERTSGNCDDFPIIIPQQGQTATEAGEQCTETYTASSDVYKLKRVDTDTRVTAPAELDFEHTVTRILEASLQEVFTCTSDDGGGDGGGDVILLSSKESWFDKIANWILPEAKALIRPPTGGGETCSSNGMQMQASLVSGGDFNIDPNEEVNFPITFTTQSSTDGGPVSLEYKMVKKGDTDVMFGDTATIPVSVSTGPSFGLTCGANQSVTQGLNANYALSATTPSGYTSTINVTMGSDPAGAAMSTTPVALSPSSLPLPYAGTAVVPTAGLTPGQTYILTFTGNDGTGTKTCQAHLTVIAVLATADLKFNGSDGPTTPSPSTGSTGTLTWNTEQASSCTGSMQTGADTSSPAWVGVRAKANIEEQTFDVTGLQPNTTYIFKIECVNSLGVAGTPDTVEVSVTGQPAEPTATLECMGENNKHPIDGPCTVAIGGSGLLFWDSSYASSCTIDPDFGAVATSETEGQSTGAVKEETTYTLTCEGASGTTPATDSVQILVDDETAPSPPIVSTDNTVCGTITVSWTPGATPPDITNYAVFNSTTGSSGPWTDVSGLLDPSTTSFPHTTATASNNYYMVIAYNGTTPSADSNAELGNSLACTPVIDASDKDVFRVDGKIDKAFSPTACSGASEIASLPNNALFSAGDIVTFKINVCNSGSLPLSGVSVTDTLEKLTEPSTPTSSCTLTNYSYDGNKTMTFNLSDIPAKDPDSSLPSVCSVTFTARVTAPGTATAALYRFQNIADIRTNELAVKRVITPPYLFSITGGIPDRTETAPQ